MQRGLLPATTIHIPLFCHSLLVRRYCDGDLAPSLLCHTSWEPHSNEPARWIGRWNLRNRTTSPELAINIGARVSPAYRITAGEIGAASSWNMSTRGATKLTTIPTTVVTMSAPALTIDAGGWVLRWQKMVNIELGKTMNSIVCIGDYTKARSEGNCLLESTEQDVWDRGVYLHSQNFKCHLTVINIIVICNGYSYDNTRDYFLI
jgi:hypothetical protein